MVKTIPKKGKQKDKDNPVELPEETSGIKIVKRKIGTFFKDDDLQKIRQAVTDVHSIITNASVLVRALFLKYPNEEFEANQNLFDLATRVIEGDQKLQKNKERSDLTERNALRDIKIVDKKAKKLQEKRDLSADLFSKLKAIKEDIYGTKNYASKLSLSLIMSYSITNLVTAYKNNVSMHFKKYPKRIIQLQLLKEYDFSKSESNKIANKIVTHIFYNTTLEAEDGLIDGIDPKEYLEYFPKIDEEDYVSHAYNIEVTPEKYQRKMIEITLEQEQMFPDSKLLNASLPQFLHSQSHTS